MHILRTACIASIVATPFAAAAAPLDVGSYGLLSVRRCGTSGTAVACIPSADPTTTNRQVGPGQFLYSGGSGLVALDDVYNGDGGSSSLSIEYRSELKLPIVRLYSAASTAGGVYSGSPPRDDGRSWSGYRLGSNVIGLQIYSYDGPADTPFALAGAFDFTQTGFTLDSNGVNSFESPGGSAIYANIYILDPVDFATLPTLNEAADLLTACANVRAIGSADFSATSGYQMQSFVTRTVIGCDAGGYVFSDDPLILVPGEQFTVAAQLGAFSNRGGEIDATNTLIVTLDPSLPAEARAALRGGLTAAIDTPSPPALALVGLGLLAVAARRR